MLRSILRPHIRKKCSYAWRVFLYCAIKSPSLVVVELGMTRMTLMVVAVTPMDVAAVVGSLWPGNDARWPPNEGDLDQPGLGVTVGCGERGRRPDAGARLHGRRVGPWRGDRG